MQVTAPNRDAALSEAAGSNAIVIAHAHDHAAWRSVLAGRTDLGAENSVRLLTPQQLHADQALTFDGAVLIVDALERGINAGRRGRPVRTVLITGTLPSPQRQGRVWRG